MLGEYTKDEGVEFFESVVKPVLKKCELQHGTVSCLCNPLMCAIYVFKAGW